MVLLLIAKPYTENSYLLSFLSGTSTCIITAILILYIQRTTTACKLLKYYRHLEGTYIRHDIGQDNSSTEENENIKANNVGLEILVFYNGGHSFLANANYWEKEKAEATIAFEFNDTNNKIASGTYKYVKGQSVLNDFGSYKLYILENEQDKIYLRYQHVFPRESKNNPDANRGWEVWQKKINN